MTVSLALFYAAVAVWSGRILVLVVHSFCVTGLIEIKKLGIGTYIVGMDRPHK